MTTAILVTTSLLAATLICLLWVILTRKPELPSETSPSLPENSSPPMDWSHTVQVRMEFFEQLLMRGLGLDRQERQLDTEASAVADQKQLIWQTEEMLSAPKLEEVIRREQEELDRRILLYQQATSHTMEQYRDDEEALLLREYDARGSSPSSSSPEPWTDSEPEIPPTTP